MESSAREMEYASRLAAARAGTHAGGLGDLAQKAKQLSKLATPWAAFTLLSRIRLLQDWPYFFAIAAGIGKDLIDMTFIGSLPLIGQLLALFVSLFIALMTILASMLGNKTKGNRKAAKFILRAAILSGGTVFEAFGVAVNVIPVETAMALIVYTITLFERLAPAEG